MSKRMLPFRLTSFVAENILNELKTDDSGTIPQVMPSLIAKDDDSWHKADLKPIEDVPILPKSGITKKGIKAAVEEELLKASVGINEHTAEIGDELCESEEKPAGPLLTIALQHEKYLKNLTVPELLACRREIEKKLPAVKLKDLDLEKELVLHFLNLKELMTLILYDDDVPANQKAQIANSCASLLSQMTKSQAIIYSAERVKRIETAIIKSLHGLPQEVLEDFFTRYEDVYDEM